MCDSSKHDASVDDCEGEVVHCDCGKSMCQEHVAWSQGSGSYARCYFCDDENNDDDERLDEEAEEEDEQEEEEA